MICSTENVIMCKLATSRTVDYQFAADGTDSHAVLMETQEDTVKIPGTELKFDKENVS